MQYEYVGGVMLNGGRNHAIWNEGNSPLYNLELRKFCMIHIIEFCQILWHSPSMQRYWQKSVLSKYVFFISIAMLTKS
jgi:hypothetical protein